MQLEPGAARSFFRRRPRDLARVAVLISLLLPGGFARFAYAQDVVRLGTLKFAHYGAVAYMKEIAGQHGIKIEERTFPKGVDIMPAIVAGEIDAAASAADAAIAGRASGAAIVAVAGFAKGGARIVARADAGIKRVADLKGKRVGVARGGAHELLLLAALDREKLTWSDRRDGGGKDVRIVYLAYADLNQALAGKQIEAMCQSEPQAAQALSAGFGVEISRPYDTPIGEPIRTLVLTEKLYRDRREVALRLVKALVAATRAFEKDPALAERYVREKLFRGQLGAQDYRDAIANASLSIDLSLEHITVTTELMQKYNVGRMRTPPRAADWVKLDLLAQAKAELAR